MTRTASKPARNSATQPISVADFMTEIKGIIPRVQQLKDRWTDEKGYEDFKEYTSVVSKLLPAPLHLLSMTKAFKLTVKRGEQTFEATIGFRGMTCAQVSGPKIIPEKEIEARIRKAFSEDVTLLVLNNEVRTLKRKPGFSKETFNAQVKQRYPGAIILNSLPFAKALILYKETQNIV